ncbi:apoptosis-stimulating of p53 protein 1-like isoform X2 [Brachyhypopomus gauderio]|uniref:apoptosis-stimulating of p53 protein 1-like isoform X2 n=1 Tax=Brachyhypopomus gauderio TaxID=698409 RepID=UPI00404275DF
MKRLVRMVIRSLVSMSRAGAWLRKTARTPGRPDGRTKPTAPITKMIIPVFLSANEQVLTEVPITPETLCKDVVELCREPGESGCYIVEVWRGNERAIPLDHLMLEHMQKWGQRRQEVKFYLRHEEPHAESPTEQGGQPSDCRTGRGTVDQPCQDVEQRLRYLKQQDCRQGPASSEPEKLQRLRERVESQEAKLKKVRAMRGQVDYSKIINGNLSVEIEHVSTLFQEKQAELQKAVLKVDQLSQQLDDLRQGRLQPLGAPLSANTALELRKLYQELQIRNKLNQEQNSKLQQQKDLLNKRNLEVTMMDKRVEDLRERLYRKKAELSRISGPPSPKPAASSSGRIAAVCPYIQVPVVTRQDGGHTLPPDPLKPHPLSATINHVRSKSDDEGLRKTAGQWKVSDLDIVVDPVVPWPEPRDGPGSPSGSGSSNDASWSSFSENTASSKRPEWKDSSHEGKTAIGEKDSPKLLATVTALSKQAPPSYGTYPSVGYHSKVCSTSSLPRSAPGTLAWQRAPPSSGSSSQQIQQRITVPPTGTPLLPQGERTDPPLAVAVRPFISDRGSRPQSPRKGPATMNSSSIYHMYLQSAAKNYPIGSRAAVKAVYGKPVLPSSASPSPVPFQHQAPKEETDREAEPESVPLPPPSVEHIPRPLSPTKLTPVAHSPLRYQSDADLEALRRKLANAPRPLKKRSSITEPEGPSGPNIQKLLYQRFNVLAGSMEPAGSATPFYQPHAPLGCVTAGSGSVAAGESDPSVAEPDQAPSSPTSGLGAQPSAGTEEPPLPETSGPDPKHTREDGGADTQPSAVSEPSPPTEPGATEQPASGPLVKRTNLKKPGSVRTGHGLRVKFNPLALLLDASLEGEFDLVQRIIYEVENPSTPNDEGITPLHNAVCAGHHHIVKFLLDFGVNVNAADSDGWTPLHCAASCNSVHLCKLLVESGAAIFASTISDVETAADKCEEMEEGFIQCSQFLYGVQEKLGVMNKGAVYALWDYEAQSADELSFREGDALTVLRRRDESETEWWWARLSDQEGYVPRNLLGLYPRIKPRQRSLA